VKFDVRSGNLGQLDDTAADEVDMRHC
jgi:hypothetical protein